MKKLIPLFALVALVTGAFAQQNNQECTNKTFSFFTIFNGFEIERCEESEFASYDFWFDGSSRKIEKQGKFRKVSFRKKDTETRKVSGLQIVQNHVNAIKAIGGEVLKGSRDAIYKTTYRGNELWIYVSPYDENRDISNFYIASIEVQPMKQEISAVSIKNTIDANGKIALYGILFDTGKADIKPESEKTLKEIAAYLQSNPDISVYLVGHTDNVGDPISNMKLSKSRGEAVKNYLVTKSGISANRLTGDGVGSLCPVASNTTEEGKKYNRRVEIVQK